MRKSGVDAIMESGAAILVVAALAVVLGVIFIFTAGNNPKVTKQEAVSTVGVFDRFENWENDKEIYFSNGEVYHLYPHTQTVEFLDRMSAMEKGTVLYLRINPKTDYVVEVRTETEKLLDFEDSQAAIDRYDNGYVAIGVAVIAMGVFLVWYGFASDSNRRKQEKKKKKSKPGQSQPLRRADERAKCRILLEASTNGYRICYRRVRQVNELVINGMVYDEHKAMLEFPHELQATVNGHRFAAGYEEDDEGGNSYIVYDGQRIAEKVRLI